MKEQFVRRMLTGALVLCFTLGALAVPAEARRASTKSKRALRKQAKKLFGQAQIHYRLGRFAKARKLYTRAYEVLPLPGFLYNIAQCHRMEKRYERAIFFYRSYLSAKPGAKNADMVMLLIRRSKAALKRQQAKAAARKRAEAAARRRALRPVLVVTPKPQPRPYLPPDKSRDKPLVKKWWFWTSIGVGVAAVVAASVVAALFARPPEFEQTDLGILDRRLR